MIELLLETMPTEDSVGASDQQLEDYRAVMRRINGGECDFAQSRIALQSLEDAVERNATFKEAGFPPFIFFGSNGGGEGYAWDLRPERHSLYVGKTFSVRGGPLRRSGR